MRDTIPHTKSRICQNFLQIPPQDSIKLLSMANRIGQFCYRCLLSRPRGWLQRTRLWRLTSRGERLLALIALFITLPSVYFLARDALASQRLAGEIECLAQNIYHEARGEPIAGQFAVAEVTLNRMRSHEFPNSVCKVVYQTHWNPSRKEIVHAFSWTGLKVTTNLHSAAWRQAWEIARTVLTRDRKPTLAGALYYHSVNVKPTWSHTHKRLAIIGRHIFYL
jgi:N-acetylmuramoyl-L-alanine amidase